MKTFYRVAIVLTILLFTANLNAQVFTIDTLVYNGDPSNRINLVIMGDGYTLLDTAQFRTDALSVANYFLSVHPFNQYRNFFNFFSIKVISNDSGNDHPGTAVDEPGSSHPVTSVDNYLESTFDYGVHRCVYSNNTGLVFSIANTNFPQYDLVNVIVNTPYYGGCGGSVAFTSMHSASAEVFVHEFGHSFASLSDEYDYGSVCAPGTAQNINVSQQTDTSLLVWKSWLTTAPIPTPAGTDCNLIGLYEGAQYCVTNWYRPKCNCKMRALNQPFCEVCTERLICKIDTLVNLIDEYSPPNNAVTVCKNAAQLFTVTSVKTIPNTIRTQWFVDNSLVVSNDTSFTFDASLFSAGLHQVKAVNYDTTLEVKKVLASYQQVWNVSVVNPMNGAAFAVAGDTLISPYSQSQWFVTGNSSAISTADITVCSQPGNYYVTGTDANGCSAISDTFFISCTVTASGNMQSHAPDISVLPNPFNNDISIYADGIKQSLYSITISDVLGRVVNNTEVDATGNSFSTKLATVNLNKGIYFLVITSDNFIFSKKIVKE